MKALKEVDEQISKIVNKNKKELDTALIKPIHKAHPFSSNGMYCFIGKPGSGKTYKEHKNKTFRRYHYAVRYQAYTVI